MLSIEESRGFFLQDNVFLDIRVSGRRATAAAAK